MKILLVDDDEGFCKMMSRMLADRGYLLKVASGGREALRCMEAELPDLVLSDIRMPGMGGIELLLAIGARFPGTPVVLMTGCGDPDYSGAAFQHGANGYLQKPIKVEALLAGILRLEEGVR